MEKQNEIIVYQPDSTLSLDVRVENETVWLTQSQMTNLFQTTRNNITMHIRNIFKEGELEQTSVCKESLLTAADGKRYKTNYYNLDVIISVGYRVKSLRGTQFRQWANRVLKDYLLKGYAINQRLIQLEDKMDRKFAEHDLQISQINKDIDFFIKTAIPPKEGIFFEGQIFDAYTFVCELIKSARNRLILIDNYIDETVLTLPSKRTENVSAKIVTERISSQLKLYLEKHNQQYLPIQIIKSKNIHDRFLIVDDNVYHIGASIKDLGKKLFAFSKLELMTADNLIRHVMK